MVETVPKHLGIVMDGNRRFSRRLMLKPWKGHEWGAKKVEKVLDWSKEYGIKELTLYSFSIENFNRPKDEFNYLMDLFEKEFNRIKEDPKVMEESIRIRFIGRIHMFPENIQRCMKDLTELTKDNDQITVNFAMAYGGRSEVVDATKKIALAVKEGKLDIDQINEESFADNLYCNSDPDLVIRTGGEHRTSNFMNYQAAYAELIFVEKLWPEFEKEDFVQAIQEYSKRDRRFGG